MSARDRQPTSLACTCTRMALAAIVCVLASGTAWAELEVTIAVDPERPIAPTPIALTASVASADPIVSYRWFGLDSEPQCRQERCDLSVSIASCRRVAVEVTTIFGERATGERWVCADGAGGSPPRAVLRVEERADTFLVAPSVTIGSDPTVLRRFWIDTNEVTGEPTAAVPKGGGCHAIDFWVMDSKGRVGMDRRTICGDDDAPLMRITAMPEVCPPKPMRLSLCGNVEHPLGLTVERASGDVPIDGCSDEIEPPAATERQTVRIRDARGVESVASILTCSAPSGGDPVLFHAALSGPTRVLESAELRLDLSLYGGNAPFEVKGTLASAAGGAPQVAENMGDDLHPTLSIRAVSPGVGPRLFEAEVTDRFGFKVRSSAVIEVRSKDDEPSNTPSAALGGCSTTRRSGTLEMLGAMALLWLVRRVRR
jgi:hypothetical protein